MTADNSAVAFDENDTEVLFSSGERVTKWSLTNGALLDSWKLPLGLNDSLVTRPGKKPILIRRDPWPPSPQTAIRARELERKGKLSELYVLKNIKATEVQDTFLSSDGRMLLVNLNPPERDRNRQLRLFDGLTGESILAEKTSALPKNMYGRLSATGTAMSALNIVDDKPKYHVYGLPEFKQLGTGSGDLERIDDVGKLGLSSAGQDRPAEWGVALVRAGETVPVVTFDSGRAPTGHAFGISKDGQFVYWGRRDGTVCVADVNKCLEQLTPFGK